MAFGSGFQLRHPNSFPALLSFFLNHRPLLRRSELRSCVVREKPMLTCRILPSVTTQSTQGHTWREKINEIALLQLKEVCLFVTGLSGEERQECYSLLEEVQRCHAFRIPFVHAVSSMHEEEFSYLTSRFGTEKFNLHTTSEYPLHHLLSNGLRQKIFIENVLPHPLTLRDIQGFGGICFDLSHLEEARRTSGQEYHRLLALTGKAAVGANHISAVSASGISRHLADDQTTMKYICNIHPSAFARLSAIELENSLSEQLCLIPVIQRAMYRSAAAAWLEEAA